MGVDWTAVKEKLECPRDDGAHYENTTWCNRDLIPIPPDRRTFGVFSYLGYWTVSGSNISAWALGSTLLTFGLSPQQAIGTVIVGGVLTGLLAVACGWMGEYHYIGFTVCSRFSWGMRGSYFPVIIRVFVGSIWFGLQAFWGGQATRVAIGALIPGFAHLPNSFDPSSHLETKDFVGLIVWMCLFIPGVLIRPEKLQTGFVVCFVLFCGSCFGLLIWAVSRNNGPGTMFQEAGTAPNIGWAFMFGITALLGAWGGGTLGQSDWTRYASRRYAPTSSQLLASPVTIAVTAIIGIVVTSASRDILGGELQWNPIYLLAKIQDYYNSSSGARAGVFFASSGLVCSQLAISLVLNAMSAGMDMAGLWPKYINIRRGAYIMTMIGILTQPWQLLMSASKFLAVMGGFGVFLAPATGILLADYHVVRRYRLKLDDLYVGDASSIYWFHHGFNWRAFVAFFAGVWPLLPGLVGTVNVGTFAASSGWARLYNLTFIVGLFIAFTVFVVLNMVFPVPGLGEERPFRANGSTYDVADPESPMEVGSKIQ
ncbi:NCS1 family nucleobase:cation symporter-1 [Ophiocordyceps sinensis CO18]|uniref:NCS1 family nucleobase:cation symporter-1 n=1 Tax=Ophiocordyceps sinensis (strain Co18 / CGMCC 3.14243) TaxID=911162 RepID=T5AJ66_OPHSC|nr:NCS1 family nucleobase:cation symporter-1 [Ophiocordyceps sinensis CO18]